MTPEYIEQLAALADPHELWRTPALEQNTMPPEQRLQLDAGVALRRYASHVRKLRGLLGTGQSLLISPLSESGTATKTVPMPESHARLLPKNKKTPNAGHQREP